MPIVIGINPVGKKKAHKKKTVRAVKHNPTKKGQAMPRKKSKKGPSTGKVKYRTRTKQVIRYRRTRAAKRVTRRRGTSTSEALNLGKMFRAAGAVSLGMIVAKVAVNKLTEGGSEKMAWTWPNIFMAAGSSVVAAFVMGAFGLKKPTVALVAVGGVGLALYKTFTCKIAPKWGWTESWFGEDEMIPMGAADDLEVMDFEPAISGYGATEGGGRLVAANPYMGQATEGGGRLVAANPYMGDATEYRKIARNSMAAYSRGGMM